MGRTLVLWVLLIAIFIGSYAFFQSRDGAETSLAEPSMLEFALGLLKQFVMILPVVVFVGWLSSRARKTIALWKRLNEAQQLGKLAEALEAGIALRRAAGERADVLQRVGSLELMLWKISPARDDLEAAANKGSQEALGPLWVAKALLGEPPGALDTVSSFGALAAAIVSSKKADWVTVGSLLGTFAAKQLPNTLGALARTLEAWSVMERTGEKRHVDPVALFAETGPGELAKVWPELIAFVERAR